MKEMKQVRGLYVSAGTDAPIVQHILYRPFSVSGQQVVTFMSYSKSGISLFHKCVTIWFVILALPYGLVGGHQVCMCKHLCGPPCKQIPIQHQLVPYAYELMSNSEWRSTATPQNNGCCLKQQTAASQSPFLLLLIKKKKYCFYIVASFLIRATKNY